MPKIKHIIEIVFDGRPCSIVAGDYPRQLARLLGQSRRAVLVSNPAVFALHGKAFMQSMLPSSWEITPVMMGDGEQYKSRRTVEALYEQLLDIGAGRDDLVIAFGGGVVGDTAGFAAATFMRGIDYIQAPTTLLAMVDAAIGAKVAINHQRGKNLIGAFHPPRAIIAQPLWLGTLPLREMNAGLAEIIKIGFLSSRQFLEPAAGLTAEALRPDNPRLVALTRGAMLFKAEIVAHDPYDLGIRTILNFGHTFAHAIEKAEGYRRYRHGEAVVAGMAGALYLSHAMRFLDCRKTTKYLQYLTQRAATLPLLKRDIGEYLAPLAVDKKTRNQGLTMVLLKRIGRPVISIVESPAKLRKAMTEMVDFVNSRGEI